MNITKNKSENAIAVEKNEKFTYREINSIVNAVKNINTTSVVIADTKDIEALVKNRNILATHNEVYTLKTRPLPDFDKYQQEVTRIRRAGGPKVVDELNVLDVTYAKTIAAEESRRIETAGLLNSEVEVKGIIKIKRSAIKAQSAQDISFICAIDKLLED